MRPDTALTFGVVVLVLLTGGLTALAALLVWRHGYLRGWRAARHQPPRCLFCGYILSGLSPCRCPECGRHWSLDELWQQSVTRGSGVD